MFLLLFELLSESKMLSVQMQYLLLYSYIPCFHQCKVRSGKHRLLKDSFKILSFIVYHKLNDLFITGACNAIVYGLDKETASRLTPTQIKVSTSDAKFKFLQ